MPEVTSPNNSVKLSDLSMVQLKALCYDQVVLRDRALENLRLLETEMQRRAQEESKKEKSEPTENKEDPVEEEKK